MAKYWTGEEIQFLKENCVDMDDEELAKKLGRSVKSVKGKMFTTGFTKLRKGGLYEVMKGYEVIASGTARECAEQLGLNTSAIYRYASLEYQESQRNLEDAIVAFKIEREEMLE